LAVRGHLRITELPRASGAAVPDWTLTRRVSGESLEDYEQQLLDAVAPPGATVTISELSGNLGPAIGQVQDSLYRRVVSAGWFARHPAAAERPAGLPWLILGAGVALTVALAIWTSWALPGVAVIAVGLMALATLRSRPLLTARGAAVVAGLNRLARDLHDQPTVLPRGRELAEASAILPYAIVLGGWDRWLSALVASGPSNNDATALDWYQGPPGWQRASLPDSLDGFITVTTGRLFARA
jgi:hypothetical protein